MAKFCRKCGSKLNETTGFCPNCDVAKIENCSAQEKLIEASRQRQEMVQTTDESLSKKDVKKKRKANKKAKKKEKRKQWSIGKKIFRFILKIILIAFLLWALGIGVLGTLVYFEIVDVPEISYLLERSGVQKEQNVSVDPMKDNYVPDEDSVSYDGKANQFYANNEIIVVFSNNATEIQKETVIDFLNGELVGTVPELNMYQIMIDDCDTLEELIGIASEITESFDYVIYATYDSATVNQADAYSPNDPWNGDVGKDDWGDETIDGSNWWIEAINAQYAWDHNDKFSNIVIGICDSSFDTGHEELKNRVSFPNEILESRNVVTPWWYNFDNLKHLKSWSVSKQENYHGTHVAGIIGAEGNNKKGITGIVHNCNLLLAPYYRSENMDAYLAWDSSTYANLSYLVKAGAKVINFSQGKTNFLEEGTNNIAYGKEIIEREGHLAAVSISQLIASGYKDFIVVQSAGNGTGDTGKALDALQNGWFASITDGSITGYENILIQDVQSHVIIVGAAEQTATGFQTASFSNFGAQVDICAPGVKIYSTIPGEIFYDFQFFGGYGFGKGTSMSAPIVTGVCALTWSANTNLSAGEVKNIVCNNASVIVGANPETDDDTTYNMVDAKLSVEAALNYSEEKHLGQFEQSNIKEAEQEGQEQIVQLYKLRSSKRYSKTGYLMTYEEYDENGDVTLIEEYENDGQLYSREEYIRDEKGNITYHVYDAIEFIKETSYTYSYTEDEGRLSALCYKDGNLWQYIEYEYDDNDNLLAMIGYDQEGNETYREEYSYDENGDELKVQYSNVGGVWFSAEYEYDDKGREIRGQFVANGEISYEECVYNTKGELISKEIYNVDDSLAESIIYEYDENGNQIRARKYYSDGKPKDWYEYTYVLSEKYVKE